MSDIARHHAVEQFLYREAALLDDGQEEQWLELFSDDARYHMPTREINELEAGDAALSLINDGLEQLRLRVARLGTGLAHAEQPRSRTRRNVSNVLITADTGDEISVRSNIWIFQARLERTEALFSAVRFDTLRIAGEDEFLISERRVTIDQVVLPRSLSIFF